jgi:thioredoxin 1
MQTVLIIVVSLILLFVLLQFFARYQMKKTPMVEDSQKIVTLTDKNFQQQTKNKLVLVDFWASWCAHCRMMAPILNDLAETESSSKTFSVGKVNIEQYQSLAQKFGVRSIPTLVVFKNGKEVNRFVGVKTKDYLAEQLKKLL